MVLKISYINNIESTWWQNSYSSMNKPYSLKIVCAWRRKMYTDKNKIPGCYYQLLFVSLNDLGRCSSSTLPPRTSVW